MIPFSPAQFNGVSMALNNCPVADPQSVSVDAESSVNFQLVATDGDGDPLQYAITQAPAHGVVVLYVQSGATTYTPIAGYCGPDAFAFTASDGQCTSSPAIVSITVNCTNQCPVAEAQSVSVDAESSVNFQLVATDGDSDPLQYAITQAPVHGVVVLQVQTGAATYTPNAGYCGPDAFAFTASDGQCVSSAATVSITVDCVSGDADEDGVPDGDDECSDSVLGGTVHVGACDTGIENLIGGETVNSAGCSLQDLVTSQLAAAAADADDHGRYVFAAARAVQAMVRDGLIDASGGGAIMRCVGSSDTSKQ